MGGLCVWWGHAMNDGMFNRCSSALHNPPLPIIIPLLVPQRLGHDESLAYAPWPEHDPALLEEEEVSLPIQVNGKVRAVVQLPRDADEAAALAKALEAEGVLRHLEGKTVQKKIFVPGRILNLIVR